MRLTAIPGLRRPVVMPAPRRSEGYIGAFDVNRWRRRKEFVSRVPRRWQLRDLERKAPKHALAEIRDDFHRIVHAPNADTARAAYSTVERT